MQGHAPAPLQVKPPPTRPPQVFYTFFQRFLGIAIAPRMLGLLTVAAAFLIPEGSHAHSVLGNPLEGLIFCAAFAVGELFGHGLETWWRHTYLKHVLELHELNARHEEMLALARAERQDGDATSDRSSCSSGMAPSQSRAPAKMELPGPGSGSASITSGRSLVAQTNAHPDTNEAIGAALKASKYAAYERVRVLGRGRSGTAMLLRSPLEGTELVSKQVPLGDGLEGVELGKELARVRNEVELLREMHHPHVIEFHDCFFEGAALCILTAYASGGSLNQTVRAQDGEPLAGPVVERWLSQMVAGLHYLHSHRVLHRDFTSKNVFLDGALTVKIGDLGLSRKLSEATYLATSFCGTPYYFSPEMLSGEPYAQPSDCWALGVVLFELLTLRRAFEVIATRPTPHPRALPTGRDGCQGNNVMHLCALVMKGAYDEDALAACAHAPALRKLVTGDGLLNVDPAKRTTLEELLVTYPRQP